MDEAETMREFMREMVVRMERGTRAQVAGFETLATTVRDELAGTRGEFRLEMREMREEFRREMRDMREEFRDLRDESRAQRQALLWILDRLRNGEDPGPLTANG